MSNTEIKAVVMAAFLKVQNNYCRSERKWTSQKEEYILQMN